MQIRRATLSIAIAVLASVALALPLASNAATWRMVSDHDGSNTDEASAVRDSSGRLHIVYRDDLGSLVTGIGYRTMTPGGTLGAREAVIANWATTNNPDIELIGGLPHVFWAGQQDSNTSNPMSSGQAWSANRVSGAWAMVSAPFTTRTTAYASTQFSTTVDATNQPWGTWTSTFDISVHTGFATAGTEQNLQTAAGCCGYGSNVGASVDGEVHLVYYSNATGEEGFWMRKLAPTLGAPERLPSVTGDTMSHTSRMSAAARTTGGIYTAYCDTYPTCTSIRVAAINRANLKLRLKESQQPTIDGSVFAAAAPNGRMWVGWANRSGVFATRSNKALSKWGPLQKIAGPRNTDTIWNTSGEGSKGFLDVLANITVGSGSSQTTRIWTQRFLPQLSVTPVSSRIVNDRARTVKLRVLDAGDVLPGAKVTFRGATRTVNSMGYVTFVVPRNAATGRKSAVATATGYTSASASVVIAAPRG